ncbi:MAG: hypothetical protein M1828_006737 [Chrysothrix sp. TS-e1954]|nr:MAG: hypothetical protein M1828_006737 [Chrysothrix sp. TS-e1954]
MGLAAPKSKSVHLSPPSVPPTWSQQYGRKVLESYGWAPGAFLGAREAAQADYFTTANASHIRIALRQEGLGIGANKRSEELSSPSLGLFSDVLDRLNGQDAHETQRRHDLRAKLQANHSGEQRLGVSGFVSGGFLVGNAIISEAAVNNDESNTVMARPLEQQSSLRRLRETSQVSDTEPNSLDSCVNEVENTQKDLNLTSKESLGKRRRRHGSLGHDKSSSRRKEKAAKKEAKRSGISTRGNSKLQSSKERQREMHSNETTSHQQSKPPFSSPSRASVTLTNAGPGASSWKTQRKSRLHGSRRVCSQVNDRSLKEVRRQLMIAIQSNALTLADSHDILRTSQMNIFSRGIGETLLVVDTDIYGKVPTKTATRLQVFAAHCTQSDRRDGQSPRTTTISYERSRGHEGVGSSDETPSADIDNASASASQESVRSSASSVEPVEPSDSVSRPRSSRRFVRESSREDQDRRVPVPEPLPHRPSRRSSHGTRERRHYNRRRRSPSRSSSSVDSYEDGGAYTRRHRYAWIPNPPSGPGYPPSNIGAPTYSGYPAQPGVHPQSLVPYQQPDPYAYFQGNPFTTPMYAQPNPLSPPISSPTSGYFMQDPYRPAPQQAIMPYSPPVNNYYMPPPIQSQPPPPAPPPARTEAPAPKSKAPVDKETEERLNKLQEMILAQEKERVAKEKEWEARLEAEKKAAEAKEAEKAAKAEAERQKNEAVADAAKKAKDIAEDEANAKAKEAQEKHEKAIKEAREATDKAKKAEEKAKENEAKLKPTPDDAKSPITFKDALGRRFQFPWRYCKTWKGMEDLICQAFVHVDIEKYVQERQYDLVGPNGIILPHVWDFTIQPDWTVTMEMWPGVAEEQRRANEPKVAPVPVPPLPQQNRKGDKKSRRSKSAFVVPVPPAPDIPGAAPDPNVAVPSGAVDLGQSKSKRRTVPRFLSWTAGGQAPRRRR